MGEEIHKHTFTGADFDRYNDKLREETALLKELFDNRAFSSDHGVGGYELEAWLVDAGFKAAPVNKRYLELLGDPMICAELAMFNIEINSLAMRLEHGALGRKQNELEEKLKSLNATAAEMGVSVVMTGILPTVTPNELIPENMSEMNRYRALNDQLIAQRKGVPFHIDIEGRDRLRIDHGSVMLEAATTALQVQLQVSFEKAVRFYNAGLVITAPVVAAAANSPFVFGKELWEESRIPLFEQSLGGFRGGRSKELEPNRVTLGHGYARESLFEVFEENLNRYEPLLPRMYDGPPSTFSHLRLHNGAIWRWVRPLIGFNEDGSHHLRIEHRVAAAGPSPVDIIANTAFIYGLLEEFGTAKTPPENQISFETVKENFYSAAKDGLNAEITWLGGETVRIDELISEWLVPMALGGLVRLGLDAEEALDYVEIVKHRAVTGQNGAAWQRTFVEKHGCSMAALCEEYKKNQDSGAPVSEWTI